MQVSINAKTDVDITALGFYRSGFKWCKMAAEFGFLDTSGGIT